jgi:hypothetical protein
VHHATAPICLGLRYKPGKAVDTAHERSAGRLRGVFDEVDGDLPVADHRDVGRGRHFDDLARSRGRYMKRSHSGGIALSWPATSPHIGIVRHASWSRVP